MNIPKLRFPEFSGEWEEKGFYDIFDILQNNTFSRDQLNNETGNVYNIHYGDVLIKFGDYIDCQKEKLPFINIDNNLSKYNQESYIRNGDIIIADTAEDYSAGKVTEICNVNNLQILSGLHTFLARPKKQFASKFLGYKMNSNSYHNQVAPLVAGTKVYSINRKAIAETSISYPTRPEQQKIADFLSSVDSIIASEIKILNALQKKKKALMQKLFSQQLRFKADDGSEFPEWVEKKLGEICEILSGKRVPKGYKLTTENTGLKYITVSDMGYKYLSIQDIKYITSAIESKIKKYKVKTGDLIISVAGTIGKVNIITEEFNNANLTENCNKLTSLKNCLGHFIFYFFQSELFIDEVNRIKTSSAQPKLALDRLRAFSISLPNIKEQQKIADCLSSLDNLIQNQQKIVSNWQQRKKGLLQQMFV